jgi:hypothetical protein
MIFEREVWLAGRAMIQRYGSNAAMEAADRADELLEKGDIGGSAGWVKIMAAIEKLQAAEPGLGATVQ